MDTILISNITIGEILVSDKKLLMRKLVTRMAPRFTNTLAISMDACNILGCSSKCTMRRKDGCCLVLSRLRSFDVRENKATSLPAIKKESRNNKNAIMTKITVAVGGKTDNNGNSPAV